MDRKVVRLRGAQDDGHEARPDPEVVDAIRSLLEDAMAGRVVGVAGACRLSDGSTAEFRAGPVGGRAVLLCGPAPSLEGFDGQGRDGAP